MSTVTVTAQDVANGRHEGTVIVLQGTDPDTGECIVFAGAARPMSELMSGVIADGEATAELEAWQILARLHPCPRASQENRS